MEHLRENMNKRLIENLVTTKELAEVTMTSQKNIRSTYIHNANGKDKTKMLKALAWGTYILNELGENTSSLEIKSATAITKILRNIDVE